MWCLHRLERNNCFYVEKIEKAADFSAAFCFASFLFLIEHCRGKKGGFYKGQLIFCLWKEKFLWMEIPVTGNR